MFPANSRIDQFGVLPILYIHTFNIQTHTYMYTEFRYIYVCICIFVSQVYQKKHNERKIHPIVEKILLEYILPLKNHSKFNPNTKRID